MPWMSMPSRRVEEPAKAKENGTKVVVAKVTAKAPEEAKALGTEPRSSRATVTTAGSGGTASRNAALTHRAQPTQATSREDPSLRAKLLQPQPKTRAKARRAKMARKAKAKARVTETKNGEQARRSKSLSLSTKSAST